MLFIYSCLLLLVPDLPPTRLSYRHVSLLFLSFLALVLQLPTLADTITNLHIRCLPS